MMIEMHQNAKIAAVWLTQREKEDPAVQQKLEALYADCKPRSIPLPSSSRDLGS